MVAVRSRQKVILDLKEVFFLPLLGFKPMDLRVKRSLLSIIRAAWSGNELNGNDNTIALQSAVPKEFDSLREKRMRC